MVLKFHKEIKDPLHGFIRCTQIEIDIIDTPIFQRLQNIKQLGFAYLIYPSARHTRFEHSIGVMHVAGKMMEEMLLNDNDWIDICRKYFENSDKFQITSKYKSIEKTKDLILQITRLGGLLHDVGHLCYSHTFEQGLEPLFSDESLETIRYLEDLWKKDHDYQQYPHDKFHEFVSHLIIDQIIPNEVNHKYPKWIFSFLYTVLEAQKNDDILQIFGPIRELLDGPLDADRLDYVARDAFASGIKQGSFDIQRVINNAKIYKINGVFCLRFSIKTSDDIAAFMIFRQNLYRSLYHHRMVALYDEIMAILIQILLTSNNVVIQKKHLLMKRMLTGELSVINPDENGNINAKYLGNFTGEKLLITDPRMSFTDEIWMSTLSSFMGELSDSWKTEYHKNIGNWSGFAKSTALISDPSLLFNSFMDRRLKPIALWKDFKGFNDYFLSPLQQIIHNYILNRTINNSNMFEKLPNKLIEEFNKQSDPIKHLVEFLTAQFLEYTIKQLKTNLNDPLTISLIDFQQFIQDNNIRIPQNMIMVIKKPPKYELNIKIIDLQNKEYELSDLNPFVLSMKNIIQNTPLFHIFVQDNQRFSKSELNDLRILIKEYFTSWLTDEVLDYWISIKF